MAQATKTIKMQLKAGAANPAPPVGTMLGPTGIAIPSFCKEFNDRTSDMGDIIVPVVLTINEDRTFSFILKTPPAAVLIKKELSITKGSGKPNSEKIGEISQEQLQKIAEIKLPDLNAYSIEEAKKIIAGTAKQMGLTIAK
jgi:large subunit ribosomal protein L11